MVGFSIITFGVTSGLLSLASAQLAKFIPFYLMFIFSGAVNVGLLMFLIVWKDTLNYISIFSFVVCWGAADAVWNTITASGCCLQMHVVSASLLVLHVYFAFLCCMFILLSYVACLFCFLMLHVCCCMFVVACLLLHVCCCMFVVACLLLHVCCCMFVVTCLVLHVCKPD